MKSISSETISTIEIQKSKFICKLFPISTIEEVKVDLENIKNEYKGATHYCYAYILNQVKRFSDDGEPSGTAGMPILKVLENQKLNYILAIVIRYFGGIKLGAGGLVRAYTNSVTKALEIASQVELILGCKVEISFPYEQETRIERIIFPYPVLEKKYEEKITYMLFLPHYYLTNLTPFSYRILEENVLGVEKKVNLSIESRQ